MSCSYVLAGHKEVVLSLDTCVSSSGNVLVVTGSKDKTVNPSTYLVVLGRFVCLRFYRVASLCQCF